MQTWFCYLSIRRLGFVVAVLVGNANVIKYPYISYHLHRYVMQCKEVSINVSFPVCKLGNATAQFVNELDISAI